MAGFQVTTGTSLFQFHYGSIKRVGVVIASYKASKFQFHYGSIKSVSVSNSLCNSIIFQFHYGSIKSGIFY